ncbi:MAG: flagellar motor protein MotB [Oscillospiraceae bacterium]|jgi:chemotaxis protein MotB
MAKTKVEKDTTERWLLTYSDLMNLLLILFIILYSSSQLNAKKAAAVSSSLQQGFGNTTAVSDSAGAGTHSGSGTGSTGTGTGTGSGGTGADAYWTVDEYGEFYQEITKLIKEENLTDKVTAKLDDTGIVISFKDTVLFESGSAVLSGDALSLIDNIGGLLYGLNYSYLLVEGHTDTDPINTSRYPDNLALSSDRAGNVWRELVRCGLPPEYMAAIGYGEYRPVESNDTAEHKAQNRRVVITILKQPATTATITQGEVVSAPPSAPPEASASPSPSAEAKKKK